MKIIGGLIWSAVFSPQSFEIGWGSLFINQLNELHYEKRSKRNESGKGVERIYVLLSLWFYTRLLE
jgi:hypothetical protein